MAHARLFCVGNYATIECDAIAAALFVVNR